jgi:hypothetical protein
MFSDFGRCKAPKYKKVVSFPAGLNARKYLETSSIILNWDYTDTLNHLKINANCYIFCRQRRNESHLRQTGNESHLRRAGSE